jgi:hypothetical protein
MYEVLFGFIFLSCVVRLHSCISSLLPLDVCSCKTPLSWPISLHISTILYHLLLLIVINFISCICHLLLFVPSTGVYFHMLPFVNTHFPILPSIASCCLLLPFVHHRPNCRCSSSVCTILAPDQNATEEMRKPVIICPVSVVT